MGTRKLIKFGKNSFVVSLPKAWVEQNKLSKGSELYVEQEPGSLSIAPTRLLAEQKSAYIPVEGKNIADIEIELMAYYKANYSIFTFEGKELQEHLPAIKKLLSNMSGVEIVEQHLQKLVAKDMLDVRQVTLSSLINRMDMMVRSMFQDVLGNVEVPPDVLRDRDVDVNRIQLLVARTVRGVYENPVLGNILQVNALMASYIGQIAWVLERIGDYVKRIDDDMLRGPKTERERIKGHVKCAYDLYLTTMKAYNKEDAELAVKTHAQLVEHIGKLTKHVIDAPRKESQLAFENIKNVLRDLRLILRITIERPDVFFKHGNVKRVG